MQLRPASGQALHNSFGVQDADRLKIDDSVALILRIERNSTASRLKIDDAI